MLPQANDLPLTPRERLRWRRAMDALLIEAIFAPALRDHDFLQRGRTASPPPMPRVPLAR